MNIGNYCVISSISIMFLIGCLVHLGENDIFSMRKIRKFKMLIYLLMFEIIVDLSFAFLEGSKVPSAVLYLVKGIELIINPCMAFMVFEVFYDKRLIHKNDLMTKIRIAMIALLLVNVFLQLLGLFGLHVFVIDEENMYHRGPLVYYYVAILLVVVLAQMMGLIVFSGKNQSTMVATLSVFTMILIVSIVLRFFFNDSNYDFLCMSVAVPFLLIYYSHVTLRVDTLTKLLNRQVYQRMIRKIDFATVFIMIDANNFKMINDCYGHECGDQTMRRLGMIIRETYGEIAWCFRIGGDEFCAILKPGVLDKMIEKTPHHDIYSMIEKTMEKLDEAIVLSVQNEDDDGFLEYGVSQGYGIYYADIDYLSTKKRMCLEDVIRLADKRMYLDKEAFRRNHPEFKENPKRDMKRARVLYNPSLQVVIDDATKND